MGNQPRRRRRRRRRRSLLNSFFMSSCSSSSETQGQSVGSREKARRKFHGANWNVPADSIRNVFPSHRQFLRFLLGNISRYESFPCKHNLGERTNRTGMARQQPSCTNRRKELKIGCSRFGYKNRKHFCPQSGASIRLNFWKWSGESRYQGALLPLFFAPFLRADLLVLGQKVKTTHQVKLCRLLTSLRH